MLNTSNVAHSLLAEEVDSNSNNNNNNSSLFHDLSFLTGAGANDVCNDTYLSNYRVYDTAVFDVLKVDPEDFASQITLIDLPVFKAIQPDEMTGCGWCSKAKLEKAFHIVQFTRRFNQVNFWVQGELLRADILKNRTEILSHFIRIAKKLFELNNINACMAVVMALQSAPIYRLQKTWAGLSKRDRTTFTTLKEFVSQNENWKKLRHHLTNAKLPCIPYLGIFLTDIIRIDTLHPHSGGLESSQRKNAMNNICRIISEFQQSSYDFLKPLDYVQNYLASVRYMEELQTFIEDQNYKQSLALEPDCSAVESDCYHSHVEKATPKVVDRTVSLITSSNGIAGATAAVSLASSPDNSHGQQPSAGSSSTSHASHRRALSDHNCASHFPASFKSATLPTRMREKKSLLDDSVLGDVVSEETRSSMYFKGSDSNDSCEQAIRKAKAAIKNSVKHHHHIGAGMSISLSSLSMKEPLNPLNDMILTSNYNFEGCLQRKCLIKNYKKPTIAKWHKYWVAICEHLLFYHKQKRFVMTLRTRFTKSNRASTNAAAVINNNSDSDNPSSSTQSAPAHLLHSLTDTDRLLFRQNPSKCQSISDWLIVLSQAKNRNEIQLSDLNRGSMYKLKFENAAVANIWYQRLKEASTFKQLNGSARRPENLIALD